MRHAGSGWTAVVSIRRPDPAAADRLERALRPETPREVPRSTTSVTRASERVVALTVRAADAGAMRAAMNAYLGLIRLALESERVAQESRRPPTGA